MRTGWMAMMVLLASAVVAQAHPVLKEASPQAGAVLKKTPQEIRIAFNETLEEAFSGITLTDAAGKAIALEKTHLDATDPQVIIAAVRAPLGSGTYTVSWHTVARDTHRVAGHYSFTVK